MLAMMRSRLLIGLLLWPVSASAQNEDDLADQNKKLMQQLEATRTVITVLDARAAKAELENESLSAELERNRQRIAQLERKLNESFDQSSQSGSASESLLAEMEQLRRSHRQQVADLESRINALRESNNQEEKAEEQSSAELDTLENRNGWVAQLLGYHRGYADATRTVEISARDEQQSGALTEALKTTVGQDFTVPDLTHFAMLLVGGQIASINGVATGRIIYHNEDGNPLEFWVVQRQGRSSQVYFGENHGLNIVHWASENAEYVLIGPLAWDDFAPIAGDLYQRYGL